MKILIVDDDKSMRLIMKEYLESYGTCHFAEDGLKAFDFIKTGIVDDEPYDIIFSDITMPGLSGFKLIKNTRKIERIFNTKEHHIVLLSASFCDIDYKNWISKYCHACIAKPVTPRDITKTMTSLGFEKLSQNQINL